MALKLVLNGFQVVSAFCYLPFVIYSRVSKGPVLFVSLLSIPSFNGGLWV